MNFDSAQCSSDKYIKNRWNKWPVMNCTKPKELACILFRDTCDEYDDWVQSNIAYSSERSNNDWRQFKFIEWIKIYCTSLLMFVCSFGIHFSYLFRQIDLFLSGFTCYIAVQCHPKIFRNTKSNKNNPNLVFPVRQ